MTVSCPDRRFEGFIVVTKAWPSRPVLERISDVCLTGAALALIGPGRAADLVDRLNEFDPGAGVLLVAAPSDPMAVVIDRLGQRAVERHLRTDAERGRRVEEVDDESVVDWVTREFWKRGVGSGETTVIAADHATGAVLADQRARRRHGERPWITPEPGWEISSFDDNVDESRVSEAVFALADGLVGSSGAPLPSFPGVHRWVVAAGVYTGDGSATRLLTGPVVFHLPFEVDAASRVRRVLDLHTGVLEEEVSTSTGRLVSVRFSSRARPGTVVVRADWSGSAHQGPALLPPTDDPAFDRGTADGIEWMRVAGTPGGIAAAAVDTRGPIAGHQIDRVAAYASSPHGMPSPEGAIAAVRDAAGAGFDPLLAEHRAAWAARWEGADIVIDGDDDLQRAVRFALFHLMAAAADDEEAAVGARGLTGTSYRGHVFWDADTFTLPFLAATNPASARAMLEYRLRRLPVARAAARADGCEGARFPWESAYSGQDVTPTSARDRTGRVIPIRTGQLEEHIVAEVAWAASCYIDWTGDEHFAGGPGLDLLADTARYWASRARIESDGAHIYGVIGPDEYHEPVDDNAFTNVMAQWNLRRAADAVLAADPSPATAADAARWRAVADQLVDGFDPATGIYEQFAGFNRLEPLIIADVAPRRPIAADLLLGPRRVQNAQVLKQADVLMLHHLVPEAVRPGTLEPNLRFYEPRTAHGSSLSPGIHASLFAEARDYDPALTALRIAARLDLDDLTSTTGGGLHLATMGSVWQALVYGFAGVRPREGRLTIDPRLPPAWGGLEVRVQFHGTPLTVRVERDLLAIDADGSVPLTVDGIHYDVDRHLALRRRDNAWRER